MALPHEHYARATRSATSTETQVLVFCRHFHRFVLYACFAYLESTSEKANILYKVLSIYTYTSQVSFHTHEASVDVFGNPQ